MRLYLLLTLAWLLSVIHLSALAGPSDSDAKSGTIICCDKSNDASPKQIGHSETGGKSQEGGIQKTEVKGNGIICCEEPAPLGNKKNGNKKNATGHIGKKSQAKKSAKGNSDDRNKQICCK